MSASLLPAAPLLVPLSTALVAALLARRPGVQRLVSFGGACAALASALALLSRASTGEVQRVAFGRWPAPFGIEFAVDRLGAALVAVSALLGLAVLVYQESDADPAPRGPWLVPLVHGLLAGVGAAFATGDLFNLYVWLELMLVCSLGLLALGGGARNLDATLKYLVLGVAGTLLVLVGVALVYGVTGHLNFGALAAAAPRAGGPTWTVVLGLLTLALLVKAGAFPFFSWLPASYPTLPAPLLALFAGLLTKVGVYAVLRTLGGVFAGAPAVLYEGLGWLAAGSMLVGVLGAAYHWDLRRILSFHIVSQIGYLLLGVALGSEEGGAAALFYTVHHIVVKANLFLLGGVVFRLTGSWDLRRSGGLFAARPALAALFAVPAASLVGVPPLSGFWSKFFLLRETAVQGRWAWFALGLLVSALTLYSMAKVWLEAFWKPHPDPSWTPPRARLWPALVACGALAAVTLALGLWPQPLLELAQAAATAMRRGG